MTPQKSDVLIIGGGFMGSSSAFFLRQHGRSVTLLERDQIGQYASGVNFGNVRRQGRSRPTGALQSLLGALEALARA
ncbi:hypothetical protein PSA5_04965 [Pseudomonas syringae pv. actinidiae]|nr:hypothetical protein PSA5_04965 [Pseudomonas syringae pv. actinidiae]